MSTPGPGTPPAVPGQYVAVVAAMGRNRVIGAEGTMPWHLPEDLARFRAVTMGTPLVMGRRTFDSIGRPLPGRRTIVLTSDPAWSHPGAQRAVTLAQALALAGPGRVSVAGGGAVYAQVLAAGLADELVITHVDAEPDGDTYFPVIDPGTWQQVSRSQGTGCEYAVYRRRAPGPRDG